MKKYIIPVILPYIKQKEDWIFDNQKISEQKEELNKEKLEELIKKHLIKIEEMDEHCYVEVAFVGCDFTSLNQNIQEELLETLQKYIRMERIDSIRVSIRPNNINKKTLPFSSSVFFFLLLICSKIYTVSVRLSYYCGCFYNLPVR